MNEKWLIAPGDSRVIDIDNVAALKAGLVGGQIDIVAHDEPGIRIEIHNVTVKDLRIQANGSEVEIDHPQLRWDNFLEVFRNFGSGGPKAEISVAVPKSVRLTLGVVSASALVTGLDRDVRLNTVSGDILVDGHTGDVSANAVSGDIQLRDVTGALSANTVSGDITASGHLSKVAIDSVSGDALIDAEGRLDAVNINTVSGTTTIRIDEDLACNYAIRTVSGRVLTDGIQRSANGPTNFTGQTGVLDKVFADIRVNGVSGGVTVLRREPSFGDLS